MVGDLPLYHVSAAGSTGAENAAGGTRGVVVLQEIWGWRGPETGRLRSICDDLAAEGFEVVLPDCHRGDSASGKPDKIGWIRSVSSPVSRVVDDVRAATMWLQRQRGATSVAAVGFCWGAWAFAHASAAGVPNQTLSMRVNRCSATITSAARPSERCARRSRPIGPSSMSASRRNPCRRPPSRRPPSHPRADRRAPPPRPAARRRSSLTRPLSWCGSDVGERDRGASKTAG